MTAIAQEVHARISRQLNLMADAFEAEGPEIGSPALGMLRELASLAPWPEEEPPVTNVTASAPPGLDAPAIQAPTVKNVTVAKRTRRSQSFSQRDLARAMRAAKAEGITARFEVVGDKIVIVPIGENEVAGNGAAEGDNPWDSVLDAAHQKRPS
jgi:hypothetical protein